MQKVMMMVMMAVVLVVMAMKVEAQNGADPYEYAGFDDRDTNSVIRTSELSNGGSIQRVADSALSLGPLPSLFLLSLLALQAFF
mmetsp:Transcript_10244/g.16782  ORF Transcript_10244/g.16782 Transcript_10244/m.16782 type:complete len:84 (+) Transcript_10244:69-320(+)